MKTTLIKIFSFFLVPLLAGALSLKAGMTAHQALATTIFAASVSGTIFFWDFRLSFAFLGTSFLILTRTIDIEHLIKFASLEVILFIVGMMIIVGLLKEAGFFAWVVQLILRIRNLTARRFLLVISLASAALSAMTGEVVSIIFMVAAILEICDYFEVDPKPYIIVSVFTTNIGSAATVLGNPIGVLIASKSGLTSEDFLIKALPLSLACLAMTIGVVLLWYRRELARLDEQIKTHGANEILIRLISVPIERQLRIALGVLAGTMALIVSSHRIEILFGLENNAVLLTAPLIVAAAIMIWRHEKARDFVEKDVEWWSLLFFMLLFAQAGTLKFTGATTVFAQGMLNLAGGSHPALVGWILWVSSIGSSVMDNVVIVAAFIPIIDSFHAMGSGLEAFWWALLFGGCLGGNITLVGSTANIVAVGILEKEKLVKVRFSEWLKIGLVVGLMTTALVWVLLLVLPMHK